MVMLETARHIDSDEQITFTIGAPGGGKNLVDNNAFEAGVVFLY